MTYEEFIDIVSAKFPGLSDRQMEQFRMLDGLYREWNSKINVISRKDIDELYSHHVLHSLAIAAYIGDFGQGASVLDLGTGGGFPGIPLAILFPEVKFTLCDSIGKKITVATQVAQALGLDNVKTVNARAESLPEAFDWVVSRAVTSLDNFLPWVKGKYRQGILYLKGGESLSEEIASVMKKYRLGVGSIATWPVSVWLKDEYFNEKYVIRL